SMKISVVVPFHNAARHLASCLEALAAQRFQDAEFILVNNASRDGSRRIAEGFTARFPGGRLRVVDEERAGASVARNTGARAARGEWLAFTDADCTPDPAWLDDLSNEIKNEGDVAAIAGQVLPAAAHNTVSRFLAMYTLLPRSRPRRYREFTLVAGGFPTANFTIKRDLFETLGGFDESIPIYGEDWDLCRRIYEAGHDIRALTTAIVRHTHRSNLGGLIRQAYGFGRSHGLLLRRASTGAFIFIALLVRVAKMRAPCKVWIDLNQADKKLAALLIAGLVWHPLLVVSAVYMLYLCVAIFARGRARNIRVRALETPVFAGLLLAKSAALGWGRLMGGLKHKVLCV
ncbi:MAG: glycosyltransferase, partial [Chitinivibrionales bacterium]|nr:glycosyltransferase [Chitinivibrionales bacterium]